MTHVADIEWDAWNPVQRAVLLFVVRDGEMLLIHKKRGLGMGKINAPGGRIDPGETPLEAAVRETQEEVCVTPASPELRGELFFQFLDGLSLHCTVFMSNACEGIPVETDEADPLWVPVTEIPYDRMWQDDAYWLPLMLQNIPFRGYFIFDRDSMVDMRLDQEPPGPRTTARLKAR